MYALILAGSDLYSSKIWEITWLSFSLAWGTIRIFIVRNTGHASTDIHQEENIWGFGQVVAVVMLALPLLSIIEAYTSFASNTMETPRDTPSHTMPHPDYTDDRQLTLNLAADTEGTSPRCPLNAAQQIRNEPWYSKLLVLWYLLSIAFAADLLYSFAADKGIQSLASSGGIKLQVLQYLVWGLLNLAILFLSTLLFLDKDLNRFWEQWSLGKYLSKKKLVSGILWAVIITVLVGVSVSWDVDYEYVTDMPGLVPEWY
ncbi:hypothetical protein IFM58399_09798 [Aspergillus lentulus]|uniref:Uncharacterized protein n=1 Tax=Aspergillus lentulus TaxID=293939 RepID=A0ABQ1B5R2_ASPLE|nr:uncharacterized protein IFM58399_09798 [Aspergillus lentulus]GFF54334.1 hypothetical protein IFM58399_09798 [Aspergillus lentulus]GFF92828.1 hypothetical protein IFM60648_09877 [Aspergillus lentulus]GFF96072.1 hypothetical protein IFM47457_10688 [Aspergillus lentulus]